MKIYFASDHAGFELKDALIKYASELGYATEDLGAHTLNPDDDYPDFIMPLAVRVAAESDSRGIIIGGSGQGEAMAANRVKGIRAAVFYSPAQCRDVKRPDIDIIQVMREHNNANILSLGARFITPEEAEIAVKSFLETPFSDSPRHTRRLAEF